MRHPCVKTRSKESFRLESGYRYHSGSDAICSVQPPKIEDLMRTTVSDKTAVNDQTRRACRCNRILAGMVAVVMLFFAGCRSGGRLPDKSSSTYAQFVSSFYVGLAALQVGDDVRADNSLEQATKLVPGEPAAWANWGILALRQRSFDAGSQRLDRARELAPKNDRIYYLLGLLESNRGDSAKA